MPRNSIIDNVHKLNDVPGTIIHGRYDMICPLSEAWKLHKAWPQSELLIIPDAGHSTADPGIVDAIVQTGKTIAEQG